MSRIVRRLPSLKVKSSFAGRPAANSLLSLHGCDALRLLISCVLVAVTGLATVAAQNLQYTANKPDLALRSDLRVDPSTLGMSIQIPFRVYPGRGSTGVPVTLYYSSKVWRIQYDDQVNGNTSGCSNDPIIEVGTECRTTTVARYAESSVAGWTSSFSFPIVEWNDEKYDTSGRPCASCLGRGDRGYHVKRLHVRMPDGSSHELRVSDAPAFGNDPLGAATYHAVDGSRLRYEAAAVAPNTVSAGTLYMPDGSRYVLGVRDAAGQPTYKFVDRHGNTIVSSETGNSLTVPSTQTDTLGRAFNSPPLDNSTARDLTYTLPGVGGAQQSYIFRWRNLGDAGVLAPDPVTGEIPALHHVGDHAKFSNNVYGPTLFPSPSDDTWVLTDGTVFNPVVLHEIVLPDGSLYRFNYNQYGEIAKVLYPTGGYERYQYAEVASLAQLTAPYTQANRGVVKRWVSASGAQSDEVPWLYSSTGEVVSVTAPDSTTTVRRHHRGRAPGDVTHGFDDARAGMIYDERSYSASGVLLRRKLTEWSVRGPQAGGWGTATRDQRVEREVEILFDATGANALYAVTAYEYGQASQPLNATSVTQFAYNSTMAKSAAQDAPAASFVAEPSLKVRRTETTYLDAPAYAARNLVALPLSTRVKDASDLVIAHTEARYDEPSYAVLACDATGTATWTDPGTEARGNPTTARAWLNLPAPARWIETHAQFDRCGNARRAWDAHEEAAATHGRLSEVEYSLVFHNAYPTQSLTPAPDPSGLKGSNSSLDTTTEYDFSTGLVISTTDANGQTTTLSYVAPNGVTDPLDRLRRVTQPDGGWTAYEYQVAANNSYVRTQTAIDDSRATDSYQYFDGLGRASRAYAFDGTDASRTWTAVKTKYDTMGRVWKVSNPVFAANRNDFEPPADALTTNVYDALGRVKTVTTPDGASVTNDYAGSEVTITDQAGRKKRSVTDALGRLVKVYEAPGVPGYNHETAYEYDTLDNLTRVVQGVQTRVFTYDSLGRLASAANPESGTVTYEYDASGNLLRKRDARDVRTSYVYDNLNRVTRRSHAYVGAGSPPASYAATPAVDYFYDGRGMPSGVPASQHPNGHLTAVKSSVSETLYTEFDVMGRVRAHRQVTDTGAGGVQAYMMEYDYNLMGALVSQKYPSGRVVTTEYDAAGRIAGVKKGGAGYYAGASPNDATNRVRYTAHGAVSSLRLGNGLWEQNSFNSRLQPTRVGLGTSATDSSKLRLDYSYGTSDNNGNVRTQTVTIPGLTLTQAYGYDALNRLETAAENGGASWKQRFTYDRHGNRRVDPDAADTSADLVGPNPVISETNNRIVPQTGELYQYDAAGNLTRGREGQTFVYDADGRMTTFNGGAQAGGASYSYDGDGRRVKKVSGGQTTVFVYNLMGQLVAEYTDAQPELSGTRYLTRDPLGSPRVVTDSSGNVKSRHDYHPFGEEVGWRGGRGDANHYLFDDVRQKFTGQERDAETGMDYFIARYYSSQQGRFASPDPLLSSGTIYDPRTWNRYAYALNNPQNYTDPLGLYVFSEALGGSKSNVELVLEARTRQERERVSRIIKQRAKFVSAHNRAKAAANDGTLTTGQRAAAQRAVSAYGEFNDGTHDNVIVGFVRDRRMSSETYWAENGGIVVLLNFDSDRDESITLAHEGSHVADMQDYLAHEGDADAAQYDITQWETERRAFQVSSYMAQGLGLDSYYPLQSGESRNLQVWNKGWRENARDIRRTLGIHNWISTKYSAITGGDLKASNPGPRISTAPRYARP